MRAGSSGYVRSGAVKIRSRGLESSKGRKANPYVCVFVVAGRDCEIWCVCGEGAPTKPCVRTRVCCMAPSFIDSPFTTKVEYDKWVAAGCPKMEGASLTTAMATMDISESSGAAGSAAATEDPASWGNLEFSDARKAHVKAEFEKAVGAAGRMELKKVHALLFNKVERGEYDFDTFDTDAQATCPGCSNDMGWADVQKFFDENL